MNKIFRRGFRLAIVAGIGCLLLVLVCNQVVVRHAKGKVFSDMDRLRPVEYGLLLGTTPQTRIGGRTNQFFTARIEAAERLYKEDVIGRILVCGDEDSLDGVNEVECMRDSLVARGVDPADILLDGKGFSTLESVVRAVDVYGCHSFVVISQKFHNERAVFLAERLGLDVHDVQGYNAADPTSKMALVTYLREYLARVKAFIDIYLCRGFGCGSPAPDPAA